MAKASQVSSSIAARALRTRGLVRAPVWLYRARLGFLIGPRLLMLEHTGRKTGQRRYVVLEIVGRPAPGTYVVVSGFGERAQWFRDSTANPRVRIWIKGRPPAAATARRLSPRHATAALAAYAASHPRVWAALKPVLDNTLGTTTQGRETGPPVIELMSLEAARPIRTGSDGLTGAEHRQFSEGPRCLLEGIRPV